MGVMETEFAIIGGGVVGLSLAYGLLKKGKKVTVFDEGDGAFRASVGNFGLIWVQGKGSNEPAYARWTRRSAAAYRDFANELSGVAEQDFCLVQTGGYFIHTSEQVLDERRQCYQGMQDQLEGDYPFERVTPAQLKLAEPNIGPKVAGAIYHAEDGHLNPLLLLKALATAVRRLGGRVINGCKITDVEQGQNGYKLMGATEQHCVAEKVVLSAGLGASELGSQLGFKAPIRPQQGQILITEKMPKLVNKPNAVVRQVNEGGIQIGASKTDVGLNNKEDQQTVSAIARHAVDLFPKLAKVKLVRSWAALRIMSPDGLPIYQESTKYKGVFFVTCHSGITLAAAHSEFLSDWLIGTESSLDLSPFSEARFHV